MYRIFRGFKPLAASARLYGFEGDDAEDLTDNTFELSYTIKSMLDVPNFSRIILTETALETYVN